MHLSTSFLDCTWKYYFYQIMTRLFCYHISCSPLLSFEWPASHSLFRQKQLLLPIPSTPPPHSQELTSSFIICGRQTLEFQQKGPFEKQMQWTLHHIMLSLANPEKPTFIQNSLDFSQLDSQCFQNKQMHQCDVEWGQPCALLFTAARLNSTSLGLTEQDRAPISHVLVSAVVLFTKRAVSVSCVCEQSPFCFLDKPGG